MISATNGIMMEMKKGRESLYMGWSGKASLGRWQLSWDMKNDKELVMCKSKRWASVRPRKGLSRQGIERRQELLDAARRRKWGSSAGVDNRIEIWNPYWTIMVLTDVLKWCNYPHCTYNPFLSYGFCSYGAFIFRIWLVFSQEELNIYIHSL